MAYPLTGTLIDDFNRANGGIGAAYTSLGGGFNVSSNQVQGTGTGSNVVYRNDLTPAADCEIVIAVPTLPTGTNQAIRFYARWNTTSYNGYGLVVLYTGTTWSWYLYRVTGGTPTQIGSTVTGQALSAGDRIGFQLVGSTITGYRYTGGAWAQVITATDATYSAAGRLAFGVDGQTARLDDLYGGGATQEVIGLPAPAIAGAAVAVASGETGSTDATVTGLPAPARAGAAVGIVTSAGNATVTGLPAAARLGTARAAVSATPVTSVKLGVIGDSDLDEFRADDNRGGTYAAVTFSPTEMLVRVLGWNLGTWATRGEPRRTGYAQNWARSTATLGTVYAGSGSHSVTGDGQHTGLAAQVTAGDVDAVAVIVGVNDFNLWNGTFQDVYNGTVAGANLTAKINSILDNLETVLDALIAAGATRILVSNYLDPVPLAAGAGYTDPTSQARVSNAVIAVNDGIDTIIAARAACQLFDRYNWEDLVFDGITRTPGTSFVVGGETITETTGDEPHNWVLTSTHFGTVFNGLFANAIIRALNSGFGFSLPTMTESAIVGQITGDITTTGLPAPARAGAAVGTATGTTVVNASVTGLPASAHARAALAAVTSGAVITAAPAQTRAGAAAGQVATAAVLAGLPAGTRTGAALAQAGAGAGVQSLPASARVGAAVGVVETGISVTALPAGVSTGAAVSVVSTGVSANITALPAPARLGAAISGLATTAAIAGLPAAAVAGAAGADVSTGVSVSVVALPAAARLGAAQASLTAAAVISGLTAPARAGAAASVVSTGISVTVTGLPASANIGASAASVQTSVILAALVATVRLGAAAAIVQVVTGYATPPERIYYADADNRTLITVAGNRTRHSSADDRTRHSSADDRIFEAED